MNTIRILAIACLPCLLTSPPLQSLSTHLDAEVSILDKVEFDALLSTPHRLMATEHHRLDSTAIVTIDEDKSVFGTLEARLLVVRDVLAGTNAKFVMFDYMGPKEEPARLQSTLRLDSIRPLKEALEHLCTQETQIAASSEFETEYSYQASPHFGFGMKASAHGKPGSLLDALDLSHDLERARMAGQPLPTASENERYLMIGGHKLTGLKLGTLNSLVDRIIEASQSLPK